MGRWVARDGRARRGPAPVRDSSSRIVGSETRSAGVIRRTYPEPALVPRRVFPRVTYPYYGRSRRRSVARANEIIN